MDPNILKQFENILGRDAVLREPEAMARFLAEWRGNYTGEAAAVLLPAETAQVAAVVALCNEKGIGIVPQAGNTGLSGGAVPRSADDEIVLNPERMNRIRDLSPGGFTMTVEAGCILQQVRDAARDADRFFPLSLAAQGSCCIGGVMATNAGGTNVLRYGNARDLTLGLEVVLPDGRVWDGLTALRKDNSGYDLKDLFIGSEGTLGVITAATLRLFPVPRRRETAWVSVSDAVSALRVLATLNNNCGDHLSGCELVSGNALDFVLKHIPDTRSPVQEASPWYLLVELTGPDYADLGTALQKTLSGLLQDGVVTDVVIAGNLAQSDAMWRLREGISEAQRGEGASIKHDISVPVPCVPELIEKLGEAISSHLPDARPCIFGHLGDGNLHYNVSQPAGSTPESFVEQRPAVNRLVYDTTVALGGSFSAEHGIGLLKRGELARYKSGAELDLFRSLKQALDPSGIMNPGKVIPDQLEET